MRLRAIDRKVGREIKGNEIYLLLTEALLVVIGKHSFVKLVVRG